MNTRNSLLIRASELYYQQGLNQNEIGKILGISRPTVSRILEEAKEEGIVEIIIHSPIIKNSELTRKLRDKLKLKDCVVIAGDYEYDEALQKCGQAAAHFLNSILENNSTIGISWGRAMSYLCNAIEPHSFYNLSVIQMIGSLGTGDPNMDGFELALNFAQKLNGNYSIIYGPAFVSNKEVFDYLAKEPQIASTMRKASSVDIILTGIGSIDNSESTMQTAGYLTEDERQELVFRGGVGHLLGRMFNKTGLELAINNRYPLAVELESFRNARWSVCISAGAFKAKALLAAIKADYINSVVVDESLAKTLLSMVK